MLALLLIITASLSFGVCPSSVDVSLEMESKTVEVEGKVYRRADVLVFIPVSTRELEKVPSLREEVSVEKLEGDLYRVNLKIRNVSIEKVEGASLLQRGRVIEDSIVASKIISRRPLILEPVYLFPADLREDSAVVKLPPLDPGDELEVAYLVRGPFEEPKISGGEVTKPKKVYVLVAKYSILFPYARAKTEDVNLENVKEVLEGLRRIGLRPIVRVVGIADGKTKDPDRNREVAKERARFVASKILGSGFACYLRRELAGNITGGR